MKKILLISSLMALLVAGCKKDDGDDGPPEVNRQNVAGMYTIASAKASNGALTIDLLSEMLETCQTDDHLILNADGTYTTSDEGVKCTPSVMLNGTWDVPTPTQFTIQGGAFDQIGGTFTISKYDGKVLEVNRSEVYQGFPVTITVSLQKQ